MLQSSWCVEATSLSALLRAFHNLFDVLTGSNAQLSVVHHWSLFRDDVLVLLFFLICMCQERRCARALIAYPGLPVFSSDANCTLHIVFQCGQAIVKYIVLATYGTMIGPLFFLRLYTLLHYNKNTTDRTFFD